MDTVFADASEHDDLLALVTCLDECSEVVCVRDGAGHEIPLPPSVSGALRAVVRELADGNSVTVLASHAVLTTQQAADLLGISRPYLVRLLDANAIPASKVGTHRRVHLIDVLDYRRRRAEERESVLRRMAEKAAQSGLDY